MFSKAARGAEPAELSATAPRKPMMASLIAAGVTIRGDVATAGDVHLDGAVEGDIKAGQLTVGETGSVSGTIQADSLDIRGHVTGAICARQVRLWATARVDGDISHTELSIESGAHFEGRSLMLAPVVEQQPLSVVAAE